jgi:dTMP kinase
MPARLVVIEGIDQSGKHTQTVLLAKKLRKEHYRVEILDFPNYYSPSGKIIKQFLQGHQKNFPVQALHMLYSLNRWENLDNIKQALETSNVVIMDRYTWSNLAYGIAKNLDKQWLLELDKGLPVPDLTILLTVRVRSSFDRKRKQRDEHEKDRQYLLKVDRIYRKLAKQYKWTIVNAEQTPKEIHAIIWNTINTRFKLRH